MGVWEKVRALCGCALHRHCAERGHCEAKSLTVLLSFSEGDTVELFVITRFL
jgi:hypothetical protein